MPDDRGEAERLADQFIANPVRGRELTDAIVAYANRVRQQAAQVEDCCKAVCELCREGDPVNFYNEHTYARDCKATAIREQGRGG